MNISLNEIEARALLEVLYSERTCHNGCAFEEMVETSDCSECEFPTAISSIIEKLEDMKG